MKKKNISLYCILQIFNTQNYFCFKISASYFLKMFLKFCKLQPQYFLKYIPIKSVFCVVKATSQ